MNADIALKKCNIWQIIISFGKILYNHGKETHFPGSMGISI
jgi:hypothetical protein